MLLFNFLNSVAHYSFRWRKYQILVMFMLVSIKIMIMNCLQGQTLAFIVSWMLAKVTWLTGQKHKGIIIIGSKKKGPLALCLHSFPKILNPIGDIVTWMNAVDPRVFISTNECSKKNLQTSVVSRYTHTKYQYTWHI